MSVAVARMEVMTSARRMVRVTGACVKPEACMMFEGDLSSVVACLWLLKLAHGCSLERRIRLVRSK